MVDLRPAELQTAIIIPKAAYEGYFGHYIKYAMREAMDIATLGCSVNVRLSEDKKTIRDARIAYGVAGPVPMRAPSAEAAAKGQPVNAETVDAFARAVLCGHPSPGQLAGGQGLPRAHRRGDGEAGPGQIHRTGGRCDRWLSSTS